VLCVNVVLNFDKRVSIDSKSRLKILVFTFSSSIREIAKYKGVFDFLTYLTF